MIPFLITIGRSVYRGDLITAVVPGPRQTTTSIHMINGESFTEVGLTPAEVLDRLTRYVRGGS